VPSARSPTRLEPRVRLPGMRLPRLPLPLAFLLWLLGLPAYGQLLYVSQGPSQGLYEGQVVSSLTLVADPHLDVQDLKSLVSLQPGSPFSGKQVQASIAALKAAGKFSSVDLSITPGAAGLQLTFILEPAYYVGVVDFPGITRRFSYIRLLQVVNLPDESPYDKGQIPTAENALVKFLHSDGYFQAQVHAEAQLDDRNQLANMIFHVETGKRAEIGNIQIDGPADVESSRLLASLRSWRARLTGALLKRGKSYTSGRIQRAVGLIKSTLAREKRLASMVRENPPQYHADSNRVDVSFHVEIGPEVTVRVTGARLSVIPFLSGREIKKLVPIYSEATIDRDLVEEGQRNLVDYFQSKGYFDAKVNTNFERQPNQVLLVYEIDKGKPHHIEDISFHGNRHFRDDELRSQLTIKKSHIWSRGAISQKLMQKSVDHLEARYREDGYQQVKVTPLVTDHEPQIEVRFNIEEGPQTLVAEVHVQGNDNVPLDQLTQPHGFELRPGQPFSPNRVSNDRSRITATYLDRGFLNVEVKTTVNRSPNDPQRVDVSYEIAEHQRVRIHQVLYLGQKQTKLALLQKTANLSVESPMSQGRLLQAESQVYELGVFDWASVGPPKPIASQTQEQVLVKVHEASRNEITYGFGFEVSRRGGSVPSGTVALPGLPTVGIGSHQVAPDEASYASPRGSIEFARHNLFGLGQTAALSLLASRLDQSVLATYADPRFHGSQWASLTSISIERTTENPLFAASLGDASYQLERQISRKTNTRLQLRYDFNKTYLSQLLVPELVLPQDRDVRLSTVSGTLIRDTRDKPLDAHRGVYATLDLRISPSAFGSSVNFAKFFSQFAYYKPVHSMVWANSIRLGLAKSFDGSFVPTSQLFFSGGGTSLRGFPLNAAGPQRIVPFCNVLTGTTGCVNVSVPVGGRELFILNSELRFPLGIVKNLGGVVFYDGGNVYSAINFRSFADNYTNTVGIGLRYATPVGPVRIDLGRNLNPVPGLNATQYFITLGQSF
jgi:outer membrane protein insertion porin family